MKLSAHLFFFFITINCFCQGNKSEEIREEKQKEI